MSTQILDVLGYDHITNVVNSSKFDKLSDEMKIATLCGCGLKTGLISAIVGCEKDYVDTVLGLSERTIKLAGKINAECKTKREAAAKMFDIGIPRIVIQKITGCSKNLIYNEVGGCLEVGSIKKEYEKKSGTLCWYCQHAVPKPYKGTGCSWSSKAQIPVEGCTYKGEGDIETCPKFLEDDI